MLRPTVVPLDRRRTEATPKTKRATISVVARWKKLVPGTRYVRYRGSLPGLAGSQLSHHLGPGKMGGSRVKSAWVNAGSLTSQPSAPKADALR